MLSLLQIKRSFNIQINEIYSKYIKYIGRPNSKMSFVSHSAQDRINRPLTYTDMEITSIVRLNKRNRNIEMTLSAQIVLEYDVVGANEFVSDTSAITFLDFLHNNFSSKFLVYDEDLNVVRRLEIQGSTSRTDMDDGVVSFSIDLNFTDSLEGMDERTIIDEHQVVEDRKVLEKLELMKDINIKYIEGGVD